MPAPKDPIKYLEWKKKLSDVNKGDKNAFYGKHHTEETIKKMVDLKKNISIETRKKMSDSKKNISIETRKKMSDSRKGMIISLETCKKISDAAKLRYQDKDYYNKFMENRKKLSMRPEWIKHNREANKKMSMRPEWIKHNKEANKKTSMRPEWIKNNKESNKKMTSSPEWIESHKRGREKLKSNASWYENRYGVFIKGGGFWYGGVKYDDEYKIRKIIHKLPEYRKWRNFILKRDEYKDINTKKNCKFPEVHHIITLNDLIKKYNIKTIDDARNCKEIWDTNNGITLERINHIKLHGFSYYSEQELNNLYKN